jgi:hypothetical protein
MSAQANSNSTLDLSSLTAAAYQSTTGYAYFDLGNWDRNYALYGEIGLVSNSASVDISIQHSAKSANANAWSTLLTLGSLFQDNTQSYAFEATTTFPRPLLPYGRLVATMKARSTAGVVSSIIAKFLTDK